MCRGSAYLLFSRPTWYPRIAWAAGLIAAIVLLVPGATGYCQSIDKTRNWQAMRVYVPEDQVDAVVTPDYLTIDIDDLERLLAEESRRRAQSAVQAVGIQQATYVARWTDQMLVSTASQWQVTLPSNSQPLSLGRISVALEEATQVPRGEQPNASRSGDSQAIADESLLSDLRYLDESRLQLSGGHSQANYWFGFKAKSERGDAGQQALVLDLPRAALATLLVAVPATSRLRSDLPCERTTTPESFLPANWPIDQRPRINPDEHWYVVHLSGRESCKLQLDTAWPPSLLPYRLSVSNAQSDTRIDASGVSVTTRFQLNHIAPGRTLRLILDEPLHVRSIQVNGVVSVPWRAVLDESDSGKQPIVTNSNRSGNRKRFVEVGLGEVAGDSALVTVEAIAPMALTYAGILPGIEIADAWVLDGRSTLSSEDQLEIADIVCEGSRLTTSTNGGSTIWQWSWVGQAPSVRVRLRMSSNQWTMRSLTRFNLQTDVVVASAHVQLSSDSIQGNQVTLKLADGWFVDSVALDNGPLGFATELRQNDGQASELCVRWEDRRSSLDVRLAINAHFPQRTEVDNIRLQSTRLVTLPAAEQVDTYVIEPSGRFQLVVDPELLRMRVTEEDLIPWQRELLPRLEDVWIFRGGRSPLPVVRLQRVRATLSAKLSTVVTESDQGTAIAYRILCQPISGSLDQFRLMLPIPDDVVAPTWSLVPLHGDAAKRQVLVNSVATSNSAGETLFTLDLTQDLAEPFMIEADLVLRRGGTAPVIPLPSVPQAISQDAMLVLPSSLTLPIQEIAGLQVLPPGRMPAGESSKDAVEVEPASTISLRYDPNLVSHLQVHSVATSTHGTWARSENHEHWCRHGGRMVHRSQWTFVVPVAREMAIALPEGWEPESIRVLGQQLAWTPSEGASVKVFLPKGERVQVQLECTSHVQAALWGTLEFPVPDCGLPAADKQCAIWLPGTVLAGTGPNLNSVTGFASRWRPAVWWRWLSVDASVWTPATVSPEELGASPSSSGEHSIEPAEAGAAMSTHGNWWSIKLDSASPRIWYVDRSWLSAQLIALMWLMVVVFSWVNGPRLARWWFSWVVMMAALGAVPIVGLPLVQLVCVALAVATLLVSCRMVIKGSLAVQPARETGASSLLAAKRAAIGGAVGFCFLGFGAIAAHAQSPGGVLPGDRDEVFGILIPVDSDLQVAGDYVYVPTRMSRLLSNTSQPEGTGLGVTVKTAFYSLRIINDQFSMTSTVGELTAELTIQSPRVDAELSLPFAGDELGLQRAFLDSQELFIGERLRQDDQRVVFRASDSERHTLRLIFKPKVINEKDGRGSLSVSIPPIPTARLEVMGDDLRDVAVDAIGGSQLESPRFLMAQLGPARQLALTWPLSLGRAGNVQVQSDTWIHSRGEQVMALCQLRIRGAAALPGILHVVGDGNWQPVGQDWQDGQLLDINGAAASGRPVYRIRRSSEAAEDSQTLRVLLLPREQPAAATLSIPFLSLQEAAPQQRTLALSQADTPAWKHVGTESWQPLLASQATSIWEKGRLADQPALMRVPTGTLFASLQRLPPPPLPVADEATEITVQVPDVRMRYVARWSQPIVGQSSIRLHIPTIYQVESALVDALPARFTSQRVPKQAGTSEVVVFIDAARGGMQSLQLQLSSPMRWNRDWMVPRPLLQNSRISGSRLRIYRGPEVLLVPQGLSDDVPPLEPLEAAASPLLLNLQVPVGQVELGERFRDSPSLPYAFQLTRAEGSRPVQAVLQLMRSDSGWKAQLDAVVEPSSQATDQLFFDLPSSLAASFREPLEANVPLMVWPAADSNRAILCVLPQATASGAGRVSLTVRLPTASTSQSINLPDIRILGASIQRPVWALPKSLAGEPVSWSQVGRPLGGNWRPSPAWDGMTWDAYTLYEPGANQFQAVWQTKQAAELSARLMVTRVLLHPLADKALSGQIDYWVAPRGHSYLAVRIPQHCELIGAEVGGQTVAWQQEDRQVRLLLRPNSLPVPIRLHVHWTNQPADQNPLQPRALDLPQLDAQASGAMLVGIANPGQKDGDGEFLGGTWLSLAEARKYLAEPWSALLAQATKQRMEWPAEEIAGWFAMWQPERIGLGQALDVLVTQPASDAEGTLANSAANTTVQSLWRELAGPALVSAGDVGTVRATGIESDDDRAYRWYEFTTATEPPVLKIQYSDRATGRPIWMVLAGALGPLLGGALLWLAIGRWLYRPFELLGEAVWPLWLGLAVLGSALLPVLWPGAVLTLCVMIVVWRRFTQSQRDRQFVFAPRSTR